MAKKLTILIMILGMAINSLAQVGINTTTPKAQLDIPSTNMDSPEITDGILIPRINNFPAHNPTADQHGMLVFLNTSEEGFPAGFYYWDEIVKKWQSIAVNAFSHFYGEGTNQPSNGIDDAIYRNGNIRIGGIENDEVKLGVTINSAEIDIKTGLEILNENSAETRNTYSITATNSSLTGAVKYGIKNTVSSHGEGIHYGIWNNVSQGSNGEIYGIYNDVGQTFGSGIKHYGIYSEIGSAGGNGIVYGIYSKAIGGSSAEVYAGYFEGRVAIGNPEEEYILPVARGKENQILITDDKGILSWKYPNEKKYISTGTTITGDYEIPEEAYTIRIYNNVGSITIPDASENEGRIIILINWYGNSRKNFNFLNGDEIYDVTVSESSPTITGIEGGQRMTIQSIGTRWILLSTTN